MASNFLLDCADMLEVVEQRQPRSLTDQERLDWDNLGAVIQATQKLLRMTLDADESQGDVEQRFEIPVTGGD